MNPELDPITARNNLIEAAARVLIDIANEKRAGSRRERWLIGTLAPALADIDRHCGDRAIGGAQEVKHEQA